MPIQAGETPASVLMLHSYAQEYPWTRRQHEGFLRALRAGGGFTAEVAVESLDTKRRRYDAAYAREFAEYLKFKYAGTRPTLIYTTDDNALLFARDHLARLWPDSPVFFSGVNDYGVLQWLNPTRMTGVFEKKEVAPSLGLLRRMDPEARAVVLVGDASNTYQAIEREARRDLAAYPDIRAGFVASSRIEEVLRDLRERPPGWLLLTTLGGLADEQGRVLPLNEAIGRIVALKRFRILSMEDVYQFDGVLGGYVTSGERQGESAAGLALKHLGGAPMISLPPLRISPNLYLLDAEQLERAGLRLPEALPGTVSVVNPAPGLYERHRDALILAVYFLSGTLFLVLLASWRGAIRNNRELSQTALRIEEQACALRDSERSYRGLFDGIQEAIYIQDKRGRFLDVNAGAERMYGYSREQMRGMNPLDVAAAGKNDLDAVAERFKRAWKGEPQRFSFWGRRSNGDAFPKDVSLTRGDYFGRPVVIAVAMDMTERHRVQERLRESEATYRALFEASIDALSIIDPGTGRFVDCNEAAVRLHDTGTREDFIGRTPDSLSPEFQPGGERSDVMARFYVSRAYHEGMVSFEWSHKKADGVTFPVLVSLCVFQRDGRPYILSIGRDISAQKAAEAELRVAATAFQSQEAIVITDAEQLIQRVNPAFIRVTGYTAEEVVGRTPALLRSDRHDAAFYRDLWQELLKQGHWQGEIWNRRKSGEVYPEWLTITAVRDGSGRVVNYVGMFQDITERKSAEERIRHLAYYDALTGLPNRRLLLDRLHQAVALSNRGGRHGALLFIDLDNFKLLNDTRGHDVGDQLLVHVAQRLQSGVREGDSVARLGGDEFVVMLENLEVAPAEAANQAEIVARKLLASLNHPYELSGHEHHSTPSIGVALFRDHSDQTDELLKRADLAMYQAKASGRNSIRFFDPAMQARVETRGKMENDLRRSLLRGDFLLHYQPQMDAAGRMTGVEALVRWMHPECGLVGPQDFITLAEETGLILPLGQQVLEQACRQIKRWSEKPETRHLKVSVNVSARQFHHPDFVDMVLARVDEIGIDPARLVLEITESLLIGGIDEAIEKMRALREAGIHFSIDDFGTGYSSLAYLKRLPLDELKIDRSFVADLETDDNAVAICAAFIQLAHILGLRVVAEGVESEGQRLLLAGEHGCEILQGYLFGQPMPADEVGAMLCRA